MITPRSPSALGSRWAMSAAASRRMLKVPMRFTWITLLKLSSGITPSRPRIFAAGAMPAQFTAIPQGPWASRAAFSAASALSSEATLHSMKMPPSSAATCSPRSLFRSRMATLQPAAARARAAPSPRPEAPPVTMAGVFLKSITCVLLLVPESLIETKAGSAQAFDDECNTLPATDTHGDQAVTATGTFQFRQGFDNQDGAGRTHRVAQSDRAAVRIHLVFRQAKLAADGHGLGGEGFVGFDHIQVCHRQTGVLQNLANRRNRAHAHHFRIYAGKGIAYQPGAGFQATLFGFRGTGQYHGCSTVVQAGGIARGHNAVFLERRFQACQAFYRGARAYVLVFIEHDFLATLFDGNRHDLAIEITFLDGIRGPAVAFGRKRVQFFPGQALICGNTLGGHAHVATAKRIAQNTQGQVYRTAIAHAQAFANVRQQVSTLAHGFGTTSQRHAAVAHHNQLGRADHRLHGRATQAVYVERRRAFLHTHFQGNVPGQVSVLGAGGDDVAEYRMVDIRGFYASAADGLASGGGAQFGRSQ